jgi:hypothetical protein
MSWIGLPAHDQSAGFGHMLLSDEAVPASDGWLSQDIDATDGSVAEIDGTWTISGEGADVWGSADQFHYVYKELTGDAVIVARVVDNGTGSNAWAKGGVMIRQSTEPGSVHAIMAITGGNGGGGAFQWRPEADGSSSSAHDDAAGMAPGYFVKLERVGNDITGSYSADGDTWTQQGDTQTIEMADPALIGLFVTSHADGEIRTYTFDNLSVVTMFDITAPGDVVKGVPDEARDGSVAGWPGNEHPALALDDDVSTKFLHFRGEVSPTGFMVEPAAGKTIVTGLTLTTANDAIERDPATFELSGSNDSIDGPYTLIASGDVIDFTQADAWPRFTMNATPITFENDVAYKYYQVMFPTVRDPGSANSMQIAEVELLGEVVPPPNIAWVSYHAADDEPHADAAGFGFTQAPDIEYTDLLKANGYNVVRVLTSQEPDVDFLNTMDLVIISRTASSGHYSGNGASLWNSVTTPTINLNGYTLRSSRMGFTDGTTMVDTTGDVRLTVNNPFHPIFAGIPLTDGTMDNLFAEGAVPLTTDETILSRGISINNNNIDDEGTLLATIAEASADTGPVGGMMIAEYPAGATMENSSGSPEDVLGGPRLVFLTGSREPSGVTGGQAAALYDLYEDGTQMFLNAVDYMLNPTKVVGYDFETDTQGWGDLKDGTGVTVTSETSGSGSQSLVATVDEAAHGQEQGGMASSRDFTVDDALGGIDTLSFMYRADDPDMNGGNFVFHWIMSSEAWSGGGWYGNGLWGVLIADGQWHQQTVDLSILGADAGGWEGAWGDEPAWDFRDDLLYSFEILFEPTDATTTGSKIYIDDVVFSGPGQ